MPTISLEPIEFGLLLDAVQEVIEARTENIKVLMRLGAAESYGVPFDAHQIALQRLKNKLETGKG